MRKHPPLYPMRAKSRGIQGFVSVEFRISKKGFVENIRITESKPGGVFDKSVLACVSQWQFKPGTVEGVPVATLVTTTIRFELEQ
ncbi:MAG: energy transducer TonB [Desulfobacterales bacterium]|nr:energy transducer TonB [Desulfobacterales bacterium]